MAEENREANRDLLEYARVQIRATVNEAREAVCNMRHEREKDIDLIDALGGRCDPDDAGMQERGLVQAQSWNGAIGASAAHEILMTAPEAPNDPI
jgi:hypothetical protein